MTEVRTRFAPSPTGYLHIGGARTALFSWLYARHHGGRFVLRIEDTDRERSTQAAEQAILDGMEWLQLDYDGGFYRQSERFERYQEVIQQLLEKNQAYYCHCSRERLDRLREQAMQEKRKPRYDGHCRSLGLGPADGAVIRFANPQDGEVSFTDLTRGSVVTQNAELDDLVICRPDGSPTYNFCVVVDDLDMRISHVIRGDDHINNTPRQINIYHALEAPVPAFGHVPMILGKDGSPLSKRHGAVSVIEYRNMGYLRESVLNQLVRLGWSHGDQEIFSLGEMIKLFDLSGVNKKAAVFDTDKLDWLNQHYLKTLPLETVSEQAAWHWQQAGIDPAGTEPVVDVQRERIGNLQQLVSQSRAFFEDFDEYDPAQAKKHLRLVAIPVLEALTEQLKAIEDWQQEALSAAVHQVMQQLDIGMGKVGQPLRVALTGHGASPSIDKTLLLMGRDRSLQRIETAIKWIAANRQPQEQSH